MKISKFHQPANDRYFEDFEVGATYEIGDFSLSETEIIEFARKYDPQPFHVDRDAAKETIFGGIIASGWHTSASLMRLLVDNALSSVASLGSPGIEEIRWPNPVRAGDQCRAFFTIEKARRSNSKPDRGILHTHSKVINQNDEVVMLIRSISLVLYRAK